MSESQRIVLNWKARLKQMGWPEDAIKTCISELCEAGYRQCVDDIQAKARQTDEVIQRVAAN